MSTVPEPLFHLFYKLCFYRPKYRELVIPEGPPHDRFYALLSSPDIIWHYLTSSPTHEPPEMLQRAEFCTGISFLENTALFWKKTLIASCFVCCQGELHSAVPEPDVQ